ncbi:DUF4185 domain-containing protein [Nocardia miyunensis]|uniref:DUF4185 domain-containing protein n=1 Tax=Nocardia miyunensis TaxID=282684 RepID=UPI0009FDECB1|nr:DUF4185 domain-containing protein [Nocardia miyunensis]
MHEKYFPLEEGKWSLVQVYNPDQPHHGVDLAADFGTPVYSVSDGVMAHVGIHDDEPNGYGSWLVVDSQRQWGLDFTYGHMPPDSFVNPRTGRTWQVGDEVRAGDKIAEVGSEGGSTGPHLHFEVSGPPGRFGGRWLDPMSAWMDTAVNPVHAHLRPPAAQLVDGQPNLGAADGTLVGKQLADYSAGVPSATALKNAGFVGAVRYVSDPREGWMKGKPLSRAEADELRNNGMVVVSNYQFAKGGSDTSDWIRGYDGGRQDAMRAQQLHEAAGGHRDGVIYVSVDANPNQWEWGNQVKPYLTAWQDILGRQRLGVYCNARVIDWCDGDGIGSYYWQHNWSGDTSINGDHPKAHIHQFEIDEADIDGVGIDRSVILRPSFGQWGTETAPAGAQLPPAPAVKSPGGYPVTDGLGLGCGYNAGHGQRLRIYLHTTENQDWITTAEAVANYQANTQTGSYHDIIDDSHVLNTVPYQHTAWSVLSDNPVSINIAMVCTSGAIGQWGGANPNIEGNPKTREQWLEHEAMLDMVAWDLAQHSRRERIPLDRVDIEGIGQNKSGVSSHNNYTYGSRKLKGHQDGTHWDVPDTFPYDVVLAAARAYAGQSAPPPKPVDMDAYPLKWDGIRECWGPLEGPEWCVSNRYGTESQASRDGLKRWQEALGIAGTGVYDDATKDAATRMQQLKGWPPDPRWGYGLVWKGEWDEVIRAGWRFPSEVTVPTPAPSPPSAVAIDPGPKAARSKKIADVTGPGHTDRFGVGGTDLGVMCRTPSGRILAIFGDTFLNPGVGGPDWRSPVGLLSDTTSLDQGIGWNEACGDDPRYARQLLPYSHETGEYTTILPSDVVTIGDSIYLHVMVNQSLHNVIRTELWRSDDDGRHWTDTGVRFPGDLHHNLAQLITWDCHPNGWVYVMSTSFTRNDPLILRRVPHDRIENPDAYEGWGWADGSWKWGNPPTPILEGVTSGEKFGEMCLRYIQGQWVLVNFDASSSGGYDIDVRVFENITDNLYDARKSSPIRGAAWGMEGDDAVAQLYGPSIVPGSTLDGGFHIFVSQWNTGAADGWPYRAMQFKIPVDPVVPLLRGVTAPAPMEAPGLSRQVLRQFRVPTG